VKPSPLSVPTAGRLARVGAVGLAALLFGCGVPLDGEAQSIAGDSVPFGLLDEPSEAVVPPAPASAQISLYLTSGTTLVAVARSLEAPVAPAALVSMLDDGPTADELASGLGTALGDLGTIGTVGAGGGVAQVEVSGPLGSDSSTVLAVAQVVLTLTGAPPTERVLFVSDGEPIAVPLPDGSTTVDSVDRAPFEALLG